MKTNDKIEHTTDKLDYWMGDELLLTDKQLKDQDKSMAFRIWN